MAITYENVSYDRVISNIHSLIANEFDVPISFEEHKGNQSFLINVEENILDELLVGGQTHNHTVTINYQLLSSGTYIKNSFKQVALIMERLKRLLHNNRNFSSVFFNGQVDNITYEREDDKINSSLIFSCTTMELV